MKLSDLKKELSTLEYITFVQPNNEIVPVHFHITEVGLTSAIVSNNLQSLWIYLTVPILGALLAVFSFNYFPKVTQQ